MMATASLEFPFLVDGDTIDQVRKARVMFIMRGLSGSGKSTLVSILTTKYKKAVVCSADHFFLNEETNTYEFDASMLSEAHGQCKDKATVACESNANVVIIDNTNVKKWEMKHYTNLAQRYGYTVVIVVPRTEWAFDPAVLATKNKHNVTEEKLRGKCKDFQEYLPLFWGWFVNDEGSYGCLSMGERYLRTCFDIEPRFRADLARHFDIESE